MSKSVRIGVVLFGLLVTAGLGFRAMQDERMLSDGLRNAAALERSAENAAAALANLRASLHAYLAPGQGLAFWTTRANAHIDTLREQLLALDTALADSGGSLAEALDGVDQLTAAEKRARAYAERGDSLLAGDVIFTEVRDLLAAAEEQVAGARQYLRRGTEQRLAGVRWEQAALSLGAVALWVIIALVMLPVVPAAIKDPNEWRQNLAVALKKSASAPEETGELRRDLAVAASGREGGPVEPFVPVTALASVGEICSDLSTLSDVGALSGALERAADVLGASGVIVWVASNDGSTLSPVATHGFDARLVARIGMVARDSSNLTAMAFRDNAARVSAATASTPSAAVAVAMCGPSGPVGVLSAELRAGRHADDACVALATIFAAQLATLAGPVAAPKASPQAAAR
ncbi:MAG: GAF domain-containing protein [Acidobacteriota bacterium]|nr:GAF domain-containing protein [Acidobacteriota bacterium]